MAKTKDEAGLVPRRLQQIFLWITVASFILSTVGWMLLLSRVYSDRDFRLSQFSVIALSEVLLPILLFGIAYIFVRASSSRTGHLFMSVLLAATGVILQRLFILLDWTPLSTYVRSVTRLDLTWTSLASVTVALAVYAALILFITLQKNRFDAARSVLLAFVVVALVSYAVTTFTSLLKTEFSDDSMAPGLPITLMQFAQIALPVAFAGIAYFGLPKKMRLFDKGTLLILAAAIGTTVFQSILTVDMIVRQLPGGEEFVWPNSLILAGSLSLLVYVMIFAFYRIYDRRNF